MKKIEENELRPEYDLRDLRVRKLGPGRTGFAGSTVRLERDVAEVFPDSESVNEALRFLIRITREHKPVLPGTGSGT
ncbi:MAG: hypothetical protein FJ272_12405 [Planctomycetes bacterium]|nr:hypothetical protein [Planctomycetota bacterium]